jgi:transcriptional regulator with GAF, ATPase, and Fis domain
MAEHNRKYTTEQVAEAFTKNSGNVSATARELGIHRSTVQEALRKTGLLKKPLVGGDNKGHSKPPRPSCRVRAS